MRLLEDIRQAGCGVTMDADGGLRVDGNNPEYWQTFVDQQADDVRAYLSGEAEPPPGTGARYTQWSQHLASVRQNLLQRKRREVFPTGFDVNLSPGQLLLIGGGPGSGKTTLALQCTTTALLQRDELKCVYASVEVAGEEFPLCRNAARRSP